MLDEGWLLDGWEEPEDSGRRRRPRRYYQLTEDGQRELGGLLQEARRDARFRSLVGRLA
jgi:PadR family transcriptional regulator PadR